MKTDEYALNLLSVFQLAAMNSPWLTCSQKAAVERHVDFIKKTLTEDPHDQVDC